MTYTVTVKGHSPRQVEADTPRLAAEFLTNNWVHPVSKLVEGFASNEIAVEADGKLWRYKFGVTMDRWMQEIK